MFRPDQPIKSHSEDLLGRCTFAKSLAKSILNYEQKDSISIGLFGEWGSGKTSIINMTMEEAEKCYKAKAYSASAVMCGKVLESICSKYNTKNKFLAGGLKELLDNQIIDKRIYEWGEALRKHRNIGAHVTGEKISKEDAKDLFDFANAICDYVFVLTNKFENFMKRKQKAEKK